VTGSVLARLRQPDARWAHAARVALAATAVVGVVTLVFAVAVNAFIVHRVTRDVDARLALTLAVAAGTPPGTAPTPATHSGGDVDDAPAFVWRVGRDGTIQALTVGAPTLPERDWQAGATTQTVSGRDFRLDTVATPGGWLVAGESVAEVGKTSGDVFLVELVLGALLLLVTFTGSFIVGLRASAPIEQVRRRQAEFTADASHELRTPLSVIEAEVDLALGRQRTAAEYTEALTRIGSESARLRAIVEDLLWLARADGPAPDAGRLDVVDVAAVADATAARFAAVARSGSFTLTARTGPTGAALVRADADGLDRLVTVLVDNACKYAGAGGAVDLDVACTGGRVVLTVDDSGPGIPESERALVFDRFHRADTSPGGTGLGLAIADAVVRASSGTWSIGTSPLGGARFQVAWRQVAPDLGSGDAGSGAAGSGAADSGAAAPESQPGARLGAG
jgi:signal transduction histidine kinase